MGSKFLSGRWTVVALCVLVFALCVSDSSRASEQPLHHQVKKGDTLWSISERYFGTPDLWPKLWEMNPFVTNPHLLKTGDLIQIGFSEPVAITLPDVTEQEVQEPVKGPEGPVGIRVGSITNLNARMLFLREEEKPVSVVQGTDSHKLLLSKGDLLFLNFAGKDGVKTGEEFMIYRPLSQVRHVITGDKTGYLYSARAKVILKERTVRDIYQAEIQENYTDVNMGDLVFPFIPLPSCLLPLPSDPELRGVVVAAGQLETSFGRNSIVYLDSGRDKGLLPGSMLELVRFRNIPDPEVSTDLSSLFFELFKVKSLAELYEKATRETMVYEKMVGRMIVLEAGPQTATALVLSANEDLRVGTFFRGGSSWSDSSGPSTPLPFPPCRIMGTQASGSKKKLDSL